MLLNVSTRKRLTLKDNSMCLREVSRRRSASSKRKIEVDQGYGEVSTTAGHYHDEAKKSYIIQENKKENGNDRESKIGESGSPPKLSTSSETELPQNTCFWNQKHLELIGVHADYNIYDPLTLIRSNLIKFIGNDYGLFDEHCCRSTMLSTTAACVTDLMEMIDLNADRIQQLSTNDVKALDKKVRLWTEKCLRNAKSDEERDIILRIGLSGNRFATQLAFIVSDSQDGNNLPLEGMYQRLVEEFLGIFGLKVFGTPSIRSSCLKVKKGDVTSTPDLMIFTSIDDFPTQRVLVVCEVHEQSPMRTRSKERLNKDKQRIKQHISSNLIGQHAGELLSYLPSSAFDDKGLFGIMIQGTKICFAAMEPDSGFLQQLERRTSGAKKARVHISEELNMLNRAHRKKLVRPLMELLSMQSVMNIVGESE